MVLLNHQIEFPPVELANEDGILAIGGDLGMERLLLAYRSGIFPWYNEEEPIIWWSPDPRFVLFPDALKVSKSMQSVLRNNSFRFTVNRAFSQVVSQCKNTPRDGQDGTWITAEVQKAYLQLHEAGHAHSAEAWSNGKLVGGLYGVKIGQVFFGESMFSQANNASKFAFIKYTQHLQKQGLALIDCQVYTSHLESLGAKMVTRNHFLEILEKNFD